MSFIRTLVLRKLEILQLVISNLIISKVLNVYVSIAPCLLCLCCLSFYSNDDQNLDKNSLLVAPLHLLFFAVHVMFPTKYHVYCTVCTWLWVFYCRRTVEYRNEVPNMAQMIWYTTGILHCLPRICAFGIKFINWLTAHSLPIKNNNKRINESISKI